MIDQLPKVLKPFIIYQFNFPGYNRSYTGKMGCNLHTKTNGLACKDTESAIYNHTNS